MGLVDITVEVNKNLLLFGQEGLKYNLSDDFRTAKAIKMKGEYLFFLDLFYNNKYFDDKLSKESGDLIVFLRENDIYQEPDSNFNKRKITIARMQEGNEFPKIRLSGDLTITIK